jgi:hypothetical protein
MGGTSEMEISEDRVVCFKRNLAESSKEDCGSKLAVLQMMMEMIVGCHSNLFKIN